MTAPIAPVVLTACTATGAFGQGLDALAAMLQANRSALVPNVRSDWPTPCLVGVAEGLDGPFDLLPEHDSRATRLALQGLQADGFEARVAQAVSRHGAQRVGLVLGTSAATIAVTEAAYRQLAPDGGFPPALRHPGLNHPHAVAQGVQQRLGLQGPALTVSTACSSSAKALATAERWLRLQLADAVVVAGVDALGGSLLHGFRSLGLLDPQGCRPFDATRAGIAIGEAAAYALLERQGSGVRLLGHGESLDAHHMSSPHPQGLGAEEALDAALARAGLPAEAVDFLSLHGTGTPANDPVEAALVARRYRADLHASATKGLTGHTMGAAGLLEALVCVLALQRGLCAGSGPTAQPDPALGEAFAARWRAAPAQRAVRVAASHAFGFGGSNAVVVLGC